ncbi:GNAT family protein [Paenibacillus sp. FSL R7-0337]|uniref:GNAT family N-acetyltransferase n=1 Tax=Paenibacillus sp. FSL R7-0337 TaxID=1926588 RepID=UPI00096DBD35|nr:GNAT family protein [Paenibacillus sp. FSL R7-0337]OMF99365.1 GNAT family N-acetyltransferase [Paenibacillus sp. FSL R7-0337]
MITELQTERLVLRQMRPADSTSLFSIWSDPEVTRFMNISSFTDECQAVEMIELLDNLATENQAIRYSIMEAESGRIIGSCGFNALDYDNAKAEIGYDLSRECWGKGYMLEALRALIDYAFDTLGFNRIEAKAQPANINSIKVLQRLNFSLEGTLRQSERSKGTFINLCMYSKLATD